MMFIGSNLVKHVDQNLSLTPPTKIEMIFTIMSIITQHFYNIILENLKVPDHQKFNLLLNFPIQLKYLKRNLSFFTEKHQIFPLILPERKTPPIAEDYNHEKIAINFVLILQFQEDSPFISLTVLKWILPLKEFKTQKKSEHQRANLRRAFNIEYQPTLKVPILGSPISLQPLNPVTDIVFSATNLIMDSSPTIEISSPFAPPQKLSRSGHPEIGQIDILEIGSTISFYTSNNEAKDTTQSSIVSSNTPATATRQHTDCRYHSYQLLQESRLDQLIYRNEQNCKHQLTYTTHQTLDAHKSHLSTQQIEKQNSNLWTLLFSKRKHIYLHSQNIFFPAKSLSQFLFNF